MKKRLFGLIGVTAFATVAFLATNTDTSSTNTSLTNLVKVNVANAECSPPTYGGGRCLTLAQECVGDPWSNDCDF